MPTAASSPPQPFPAPTAADPSANQKARPLATSPSAPTAFPLRPRAALASGKKTRTTTPRIPCYSQQPSRPGSTEGGTATWQPRELVTLSMQRVERALWLSASTRLGRS
ncbi:unnamed protein product [Gulo gulo]|uniref:Uncharacterized protein n=1 Tax=Gulo gulo TaxID=48420 RepID=A0A9X9MB85_GULGU|nr:unnamed protein product [Gulo gulo]